MAAVYHSRAHDRPSKARTRSGAVTFTWQDGRTEATPGYHHIEEQIAEGDKVVTRLTSFGKHEGDLPGAPRTGNELNMTSITIHRIENGRLAEKWAEKDVLSFLVNRCYETTLSLILNVGSEMVVS